MSESHELRPGLELGDHVLVARSSFRPEGEVWEAERKGKKGGSSTLVFYRDPPQFLAKPTLLEKLDHPNIARFEEFGFMEGRPVLRREGVAGESLGDRLARTSALMPFEVREIVAGILPALAAAHGMGIFHGSLDAGQVLLGVGGVVKVAGIGVVPAGTAVSRVGIRSDLRDVARVVQHMFSGGSAAATLADRLEGPGVDDAWRSFYTRLKGEGEEAFATAEEALDALRAIPVRAPKLPRRIPSWIAGPVLILGCFLVGYVALGLFILPGFLRILAGLAGAGLVIAGSKGIASPKSSGLFWCGLFFTIAARPMPAIAFTLGLGITLAGAVAFLVRSFRRRPSPRI